MVWSVKRLFSCVLAMLLIRMGIEKVLVIPIPLSILLFAYQSNSPLLIPFLLPDFKFMLKSVGFFFQQHRICRDYLIEIVGGCVLLCNNKKEKKKKKSNESKGSYWRHMLYLRYTDLHK